MYLHSSTDGQVRLLWAIWLPIDFPISYIVILGLEPTLSSTWGAGLQTWLPYLVHGVFGTVWWFYVPRIIAGFFTWLGKKRDQEKTEGVREGKSQGRR